MTTVTLNFVKSTKNTHVYGTTVEGAAVSQLYINKSALPADTPKSIVLTITPGE